MGNEICFLVTILYDQELLKCAIKVKQNDLPEDCIDYPMEPESKKLIHSLLPEHVKSCGPIVDIEEIFEVHSVTKKGDSNA